MTEVKTIRSPGGREHGAHLAARRGGDARLGAGGHVAHPDVERARPIRGVGKPRAVARPRRHQVDEGVVRELPGRCAVRSVRSVRRDVEQPQVAEGGEGDVATVGGDRRGDDPLHGLRFSRLERTRRALVVAPRKRERGLEGDVRPRRAVRRHAPDAAVARVGDLRGVSPCVSPVPRSGSHPHGTEGEDVRPLLGEARRRGSAPASAPAAARAGVGHPEPRLAPDDGRVRDPASVRAPRRRNRARVPRHDPGRAAALADDDRPEAAVRGVGQGFPIRRPLRRELVRGRVRHPLDSAVAGPARDVERPDVVGAGTIRREGDRAAIGGVGRLPLVVGTEGVLRRVGAVGRDRPDVPAPVPKRLEHDPAPVRRPLRLPRVVVHVRDRARLAAPGVHHPQRPLQVEHDPAPVRRDRRRHVRPLGDGDPHLPILRLRRRRQKKQRHGQKRPRRQGGERAERRTAAGD